MAPPDEMGCGFSSLLMVMMVLLVFGALAGSISSRNPLLILVAVGIGYGLYKVSKSNAGQNQQQEMAIKMEEYERTWYCSKCSAKFIW